MPVPQRDLELTRKRLLEWFPSRLPDATDLRMSELSGPGATGFSSDTLMFDLAWKERGHGRREELVIRLEPIGFRLFPSYDLGQQFRVLQILAETDVPVPRVFWLEEDENVLGTPFFIMGRVEGRVPADSPSYHVEGWVTEIGPDDRATIWWSGLEVLASVHRLDWRALGFGFLDDPSRGRTPLDRQLAYYEGFLEWAAQGKSYPTIEAGLDWLERSRPREPEPVAFCWGDSRLGNMIFRDNLCVAALDWEMMTLGNPDQDLAWWLFFDRHHSEGAEVPRLEGFPSREETIARYQAWSGHEVRHLEYYEVFGAFRFSVIMIRVARLMAELGLLPEESDLDANNGSTRILADLLGLPPPGA
jgi:aminoglycoside phosphotransferase (APT) family kinase protein